MSQLRKSLKANPIIKFLASIKITVVCLILLFILTLWGTIAQVEAGLYEAQQRFFYSWYFLVLGYLPFPGARLVLWVLFINLTANTIKRFVYKMSQIGILIIHFGLMTYFFAAFVTFHEVQESYLMLKENQSSNVSVSYHEWELALWKKTKEDKREVLAFDSNHFKALEMYPFLPFNIDVQVKSYYPNAQAYVNQEGNNEYLNASGIQSLQAIAKDKEPEKNIAGGLFEIFHKGKKLHTIMLYGGEIQGTSFIVERDEYFLMLRRKKYELPFTIHLNKFDMSVHPGTEIPRHFQSFVEVEHQGLKREVLIYMNEPLRYKSFALYQASYSLGQNGDKYSTLAVVKNRGHLLPYISSLITFLGLVIHFMFMAFKRKR